MSADDARLFERLGPLILEGNLVIRLTEYFEVVGITYPALLKLEDVGLLSGSENELVLWSWKAVPTYRGRGAVFNSGKARLLVLGLGDGQTELSLSTIRLTEAGKHLMVLGNFAPDDEYLEAIAEYAKKRRYFPSNPGTAWAVIAKGRAFPDRFAIAEDKVLYGQPEPPTSLAP